MQTVLNFVFGVLLLTSSLAISFIIYFLYRTGFGLKSAEFILPPLGIVTFAGIMILKSVLSENVLKKNGIIEVNQLIVNKTKFASLPPIYNDIHPSITNHLYYFDFGRNINLTSMFRSELKKTELSSDDYLDSLEFFFVEKLFIGLFTSKNNLALKFDQHSLIDYSQEFEENKLISLAMKDENNMQHLFFKKYSNSLFLPKGMRFNYVRFAGNNEAEKYRLFKFYNDLIEVEVKMIDAGINNFNASLNPFHNYLSYRIWENRYGDEVFAKRFIISFNYNFKHYSTFNESYEDYIQFFDKFYENLRLQLDWEIYSKKLENDYMLMKGQHP